MLFAENHFDADFGVSEPASTRQILDQKGAQDDDEFLSGYTFWLCRAHMRNEDWWGPALGVRCVSPEQFRRQPESEPAVVWRIIGIGSQSEINFTCKKKLLWPGVTINAGCSQTNEKKNRRNHVGTIFLQKA